MGGQRLKSVLARPVVVMIDAVWKAAFRKAAAPASMPSAVRSMKITSAATARKAMYRRSSSSRTAFRMWPLTSA